MLDVLGRSAHGNADGPAQASRRERTQPRREQPPPSPRPADLSAQTALARQLAPTGEPGSASKHDRLPRSPLRARQGMGSKPPHGCMASPSPGGSLRSLGRTYRARRSGAPTKSSWLPRPQLGPADLWAATSNSRTNGGARSTPRSTISLVSTRPASQPPTPKRSRRP